MLLVTGATGRVGAALIAAMRGNALRAAGRETRQADGPVEWVKFDFTAPSSYPSALDGVTAVFLIRPPQMADAKAFIPFLDALQERKIQRVVLLSVKGADTNPILPHHGLEKLVQTPAFDWTILRPSDFMQNLETVHRDDIRDRDEIAVPAGDGKSAFIDVDDIGVFAAKTLQEDGHVGKGYVLTGPQALSWDAVADVLSQVLGRQISYRRPNVVRFIWEQHRNGVPLPMALIMTALYTVQRFGGAAETTGELETLLGRPSTPLIDYVARQKQAWQSLRAHRETPNRAASGKTGHHQTPDQTPK
ncbi:uncharacterized protein YbjT (DUF2867 family) [Devosia sp. UYZn731]|uniref:NmrA family NAD(P)-binding protein n=1 Tax=Devosia sp. UYZn731 TaxID=3156345 RepID=UPI0033920B79